MEPLSIFFLDLDTNTKDVLDKKGIKIISDIQPNKIKHKFEEQKSSIILKAFEKYKAFDSQSFRTPKISNCKQIGLQSKQILNDMIKQYGITEIYGDRGTGKTLLGLHLILKYQKLNSKKIPLILNCSSGITFKRLQILKKGYIYRDIFSYDTLMKILKQELSKNQSQVGIILIDDISKFLKLQNRFDQQFNSILSVLLQISKKFHICILLTTLIVSDKIKYDSYCYNNASQFSGVTSAYVNNRILMLRDLKEQDHLMIILKCKQLLNDDKKQIIFEINDNGIKY